MAETGRYIYACVTYWALKYWAIIEAPSDVILPMMHHCSRVYTSFSIMTWGVKLCGEQVEENIEFCLRRKAYNKV